MSYIKEKLSLSGDFKPSIVFFAEGNPEAHFINKVLESIGGISTDDCVIYMFGGLSKLKNKISLVSKEPNFDNVNKVGFFVDAEDSPAARRDQIIDCLKIIVFPDDLENLDNQVIVDNGKKAGVFISPGNDNVGRIEDMVLEELQNKDEWECIQQYVACIKGTLGKELDEKSITQIGVSTIDGKICGLGIAFKKGILDITHKAYEPVVNMVNNLVI